MATFRIAKALKDIGGFKIYNAFRSKGDGLEQSAYDGVVRLSKQNSKFINDFARFLRENEIDVIVNMSRFFRHASIVKAVKKSERPVKIFFMQHFAPGSEMKKTTFKAGLHLLKLNPVNPLYWLRASLYPLLKLPRNLNYPKKYREVYNQSDKVILLSEGYKDEFGRIAGVSDKSKYVAIPNIFDKPQSQKIESGCQKQKRVLILSRMDEIQKRMSLALEIWRRIEMDPDLCEWHLDIVGAGHNLDIMKRLVRKYKLENVSIHGWQPREQFLVQSSILMMTSEYEGLPLSILEAQAYGCIPIAFNSFTSLQDVVEPCFNGVVVEEFGDTDGYVKKLTELMYDSAYREELMKNSLSSEDRFSSSEIAEKWLKILT